LDEWILRDEIFAAAHRWPLIVLFILTGCLLGWGLAYLLPSPYQASEEIAVELNAYRAAEDRYAADYADAEFRNLDDYKHWQMSQLEILVRSDAFLQETLDRLRQVDPAWEKTDVPGLRGMLEAYWRNAGRWRLTAEHPNPEQASQAVQVWKEVIVEKTGAAVLQSQGLFETEMRLRAIANELLSLNERFQLLPEVNAELVDLRLATGEQPAGQPLGVVERWHLQTLAARVGGPDKAWQALLEEFPTSDSSSSAYLPWLDRLLIAVDEEVEVLAARRQSLEAEQVELETRWENAIPAGQGLSATLIVAPVSIEKPEVKQIRPTSQAAAVGGIAGLLAWGLLVVFQITRRAYL